MKIVFVPCACGEVCRALDVAVSKVPFRQGGVCRIPKEFSGRECARRRTRSRIIYGPSATRSDDLREFGVSAVKFLPEMFGPNPVALAIDINIGVHVLSLRNADNLRAAPIERNGRRYRRQAAKTITRKPNCNSK